MKIRCKECIIIGDTYICDGITLTSPDNYWQERSEITPPLFIGDLRGFELRLSKTGLISVGAQKVTFKEES